MTGKEVIEKVEAYKTRTVGNALNKAKEEYQDAKGSYNDTGYDRYYNKMNRTCKGCFAAETDCHPRCGKAHGCSLGYKNDGEGHPLEECPKPKSWRQLKKLDKR